jgi:hypothetical protein
MEMRMLDFGGIFANSTEALSSGYMVLLFILRFESIVMGMNVAAKAYSRDFLAAHFRSTWPFTFF